VAVSAALMAMCPQALAKLEPSAILAVAREQTRCAGLWAKKASARATTPVPFELSLAELGSLGAQILSLKLIRILPAGLLLAINHR